MSGRPFAPFLDAQGFVVLDGGLATALAARGHPLDDKLWSAGLVLEVPDAVYAVHMAYLEAGADCITSAGYQASIEGFMAVGLGHVAAEAALRRAVSLAVEAKESFWRDPTHRIGRVEPVVAASAGPYGAYLANGSEYDGRYGVERQVLDHFHRGRLEVLFDTGADVIALETIPSFLEVEVLAGILADWPDTSAWIAMSCRDSTTMWDGTPIADAVRICNGVTSLVGVGVNCTDPSHIAGLIDEIAPETDLPVIVYPNSGETYDPRTRSWTGPSDQWLDRVGDWTAAGARVLGGCCRIGPEEIRELRLRLERIGAGAV